MDLYYGLLMIATSWFLAYLWGWSEALYWHYMVSTKSKLRQRYEHELWTGIRVVSHLFIGIKMFDVFGWFSILGMLGLISTFMFFHDGSYYLWRDNFSNSYPLKWKDYSNTSTAKITLTYDVRVKLFGWGLVLISFMFLSIFV